MSLAYTDALVTAGVTASVGTVGDSYDNALAETVNGLYKTELIYSRPVWETASTVELATMGWVNWWNTQRLHETLDYRPRYLFGGAWIVQDEQVPASRSSA